MSGVIANPKDIIRFRGQLAEFNRQLDALTTRLNGQVRELGNSWRDDEYKKFSDDMAQNIHAFKKYLESADRTLSDLQKKAEHLNNYLGHNG